MLFALYPLDANQAQVRVSVAQKAIDSLSASVGTTPPQIASISGCLLIQSEDADITYNAQSTLGTTQQLPTIFPYTLHKLDDVVQNGTLNNCLISLPRRGTKTAWSANALDILHTARLHAVRSIEQGLVYRFAQPVNMSTPMLYKELYDAMTETLATPEMIGNWFGAQQQQQDHTIDLLFGGLSYLADINARHSLALSVEEQNFILTHYQQQQRNPTLTELMMFAQINSEHCRHKIFNARWVIDGVTQENSLFDYIKHTYKSATTHPVVSAYKDNAAVMTGFAVDYLCAPQENRQYKLAQQTRHALLKVETHNHPTAISPYPGAATGVGGEIRDEVATGIGGTSLFGMAGYAVSELPHSSGHKPHKALSYPSHIASAQRIMQEAPIGTSRFNNEFGRPNLLGFLRSYTAWHQGVCYGFHKPIMIAGGVGHINALHAHKNTVADGDFIAVLGGPALRIGIGGGAASSVNASEDNTDLDFASVQRANPEMQRRAQEVIHQATLLAENNPIVFMHDVGAGGIANAIPELLKDIGAGSVIHLDRVPVDDPTLSPMEIWCNESQERYILAVRRKQWEAFAALCQQESCPVAELGVVDANSQSLVVQYSKNDRIETVVDLPLAFLFDTNITVTKHVNSEAILQSADDRQYIDTSEIDIANSLRAVLSHPTVASKQFLITIGDRSVGGLTVREQMVGAKQVPVADAAIVAAGFTTVNGYACATAERPPVALLSPAKSARLVIAEMLTNLASACVQLEDTIVSANWMAACGTNEQDSALHQAVSAASAFCAEIGVTIPVGKDSLSMHLHWRADGEQHSVTSPVSLVTTALAGMQDVRMHTTPEITTHEPTQLWLINITETPALGGSIYAHVHDIVDSQVPDVSAQRMQSFMKVMHQLHQDNLLQAYHDISDGGFITTICEMTFCSQCDLEIRLDTYIDALRLAHETEVQTMKLALWHEGSGAVVQIAKRHEEQFINILRTHHLFDCVYLVGMPTTPQDSKPQLTLTHKEQCVYTSAVDTLHQWWRNSSCIMQQKRDNSVCAAQEHEIHTQQEKVLQEKRTFVTQVPSFAHKHPKVAILRERGTNGHNEMAYAFMRAGFATQDVSMNSMLAGEHNLRNFDALAACGGFAYGDVFGAGRGWASGILHNQNIRKQFSEFFSRDDTITLGVCNGCQLLSLVVELVADAGHFPRFVSNDSGQYESRLVNVVIEKTPSVAFAGMDGAQLVVPVAHAEGKVQEVCDDAYTVMRYATYDGQPTQDYPTNPNGSDLATAGVTNKDGRITLIMPHPERVILQTRETWRTPRQLRTLVSDAEGAWMQIFYNIYKWFK